MAQPRIAPALAARAIVVAPPALATTAIAALGRRGITARIASDRELVGAASSATSDAVVAYALESAPGPAAAAELAALCERAARDERPLCLLVPPPRGSGRNVLERTAALAFLRAHGAATTYDVDAWLEAVVLLVRFGVPSGPNTAVVAPPGSWLEAQAVALTSEAELAGRASPFVAADDPTDVVLYDPELGAPPQSTPGLHVPVAARGELADDPTALHGARGAIGAIAMLGRAAERIAAGVGPAPRSASAALEINETRLTEVFGRSVGWHRIGDHETKTMLSAYSVPITRQAVAQTPSAAVEKARRAGFPVQLKPWGNDLPTEPGGCPVEKDLTSDSKVRHAYGAVLAAAGRRIDDPTTGVIVRETPPAGREVRVSFVRLPSIGWTVVLDAPGAPQIAAAPAPLRAIDAQTLAATVVSSRAGEPDPDRNGLAELLRRASHFVVDFDERRGDMRLVSLELPRVVIGGRGARTLVVDAFAELA